MSQFFQTSATSNLPVGVLVTITGNDGVKETADAAHNFNFLTAGTTVEFLGTPNTETLQFGISNLLLGSAGSSISTAQSNAGFGIDALFSLTAGLRNSAFGAGSLQSLTVNDDCTAVGYQALKLCTANNNTAVGSNALVACTTGIQNVAVGQAALGAIITSGCCVALGYSALISCTGSFNVVGGCSSMLNLSSGTNNTAFGNNAASLLLTGSYNCFLGNGAGNNYVGAESSNIAIMTLGTAAESNTIRIGTQGTGAGQQNTCYIAGIENQTLSGSPVVVTPSGQLGVGTPASFFTPNAIIYLFDDFTSNVSTAAISGSLVWGLPTASGWTFTNAAATAAHPGVIANASLSGAGSKSLILGQNTATDSPQMFLLGGGALTINWVFNIGTLSNGTNTYILVFGLGDTTTSASIANGVWMQYSSGLNSGDWTINTASSTTPTNINSTVAVTTGWHNAQIAINAAGTSATFSIDGTALGTIITNLPTSGITPLFNMVYVEGTVAAASVEVDLFYLIQILTTPR
jgi:hypothetical protein